MVQVPGWHNTGSGGGPKPVGFDPNKPTSKQKYNRADILATAAADSKRAAQNKKEMADKAFRQAGEKIKQDSKPASKIPGTNVTPEQMRKQIESAKALAAQPKGKPESNAKSAMAKVAMMRAQSGGKFTKGGSSGSFKYTGIPSLGSIANSLNVFRKSK